MQYPIILVIAARRRASAPASETDFGWLGRNSPGRRQVMFRALMNARPSHLLDPKLFDFGLTAK